MEQLSLDLRVPMNHYDFMFRDQQKDIILWAPQQEKKWSVLNKQIAREELSRHVNEPDIFITPNEFHRWRMIRLASHFNALYVDIDCHNEEVNLISLVSNALEKIERHKIPQPNAIVYTGRGIHLYWLINRTPAAALPRWQVAQNYLVKLLAADPMSSDATRVLRVIGTRNSKCNWLVSAEMLTPQVYDFDWLVDQIMPVTRAEIRDIQVKRAQNKIQRVGNTKSIYNWWYNVYQDLITIIDHHWFGGVPEGQRDRLLFLLGVSLSWFTVSDALEHEIMATARMFVPTLKDKDVKNYVSSILDRAKRSTAGGKIIWDGKEKDTRYGFKKTTIIEWLGDLYKEELIPKMKGLVPDEEVKRRERDSLRARRRATGKTKQSREDYQAKAAERREQALDLVARGFKHQEIADKLEISIESIRSLLKQAKKKGVVKSVAVYSGEASAL